MMRVRAAVSLMALCAALNAPAQDLRHVAEPVIPPVCTSLVASNSWPLDEAKIHSTGHNRGFVTAQGKHYADDDSGFVFRNCNLTGAPGVSGVFVGRPWRAFATVVFLDSTMGPNIAPEGWREWHPGETNYLGAAHYAEYNCHGPSAGRAARDPNTHLLTREEAEQFLPARYLAGADGWDPETVP